MASFRALTRAFNSLGWQATSAAHGSSTATCSHACSANSGASLLDTILLMGRRDPRSRRGKIFRDSFGKTRPWKKPQTNPYLAPVQPQQIPIPYPPQHQPQLPGAAGAAAVLGAVAFA